MSCHYHNPPITFDLMQHHLDLLKLANIEQSWDEQGWGVPMFDRKRPFGNQDIRSDMCEVLGIVPIETDDGPEYPVGARETCQQILRELVYAMEIVLETQEFRTGKYIAEGFNPWRRISGVQASMGAAK